MKHRTTLLALAPALVAFSPVADRIAFGPEEGTSLRKTFTITTDASMDDMRMLMNGEPPPMDMGSMEMSSTTTQTYELVDTYTGISDGTITSLERAFETLEVEGETSMTIPMMGEQDVSAGGESELVGQTVEFTWDAENEEYAIAFAEDSEGDDELLEDLELDMDLRVLLPADSVSEEDTWTIDPNLMLSVLAPGGNHKIDVEAEGEDMMGMGSGTDMGQNLGDMLGEIEGEVTGTLKGFREADGRRLAVIGLVVDIESTNDMTDMTREMMEEAEIEIPEGGSMEIQSVDVELTLQGEGELLWDVTGGHFASFSMSLESTSVIDSASSMSMGGMDMEMEQSVEMSGTQTFEATAVRL